MPDLEGRDLRRPLPVQVALCRPSDIDALEASIPSKGGWHAKRLDEQQTGSSQYLIAWVNGIPVGHLVLRLTGSLDEEAKAHLEDCVEINALGVLETCQGRGIGTGLISEAEEIARRHGHTRIVMAVGVDNPRAATLYERLGYADWGHGTYVTSWTENGPEGEKTVHETVRYLVKELH